jgi:hypothetical protein
MGSNEFNLLRYLMFSPCPSLPSFGLVRGELPRKACSISFRWTRTKRTEAPLRICKKRAASEALSLKLRRTCTKRTGIVPFGLVRREDASGTASVSRYDFASRLISVVSRGISRSSKFS